MREFQDCGGLPRCKLCHRGVSGATGLCTTRATSVALWSNLCTPDMSAYVGRTVTGTRWWTVKTSPCCTIKVRAARGRLTRDSRSFGPRWMSAWSRSRNWPAAWF